MRAAHILLTLFPCVLCARNNPVLPRGTAPAADYEYIVVGSGPGGGTVAANLAEAGHKVLLIDAGGDHGDELVERVAGLWPLSTEYNETRWDFYATRSPDPAVEAQNPITSYRSADGSIYTGPNPPADATPIGTLYPRAGTLGGCAQHNSLLAIRAFDSDWEAVAQATGDDSWSGATFRRLFEAIENCQYLPSGTVGHGFAGWLYTSLTSLVVAAQDLKIASIVAAALSVPGGQTPANANRDVNGPSRTIADGPYQMPLTMKDGSRSSVRDRILAVATAVDDGGRRRYHLDIKLDTLVTKVNLDDCLRATGVSYLEGKSLYRADPRSPAAGTGTPGSVNVTREVIIAGGTFNTPQLLQLSGIGPRAELERLGIPVRADLGGVGRNLRDHIEVAVVSETSSNFTVTEDCTFLQGYPGVPDPCLTQWQAGPTLDDKGPYGSSGLALGVAQTSSAAAAAQEANPDLWVYGGPGNFQGFFPGWAAASADPRYWVWITLKASTRNRAGAVTLASADPRDVPTIAFNTFEDAATRERDLAALAEGIALARGIMDQTTAADGSTFTEATPGRAAVPAANEAAVKEYARTHSFGHHACCTASIGGDDDPMAVLDPTFRVRGGIKGLRVVDASAFPVVPGFFIQLPTYLLAEKATQAILADY